jgi:hypothetical protein
MVKRLDSKLSRAKKKLQKGDTYVCSTCGLKVKIEKPCDREGINKISCCGSNMQLQVNESGNA